MEVTNLYFCGGVFAIQKHTVGFIILIDHRAGLKNQLVAHNST